MTGGKKDEKTRIDRNAFNNDGLPYREYCRCICSLTVEDIPCFGGEQWAVASTDDSIVIIYVFQYPLGEANPGVLLEYLYDIGEDSTLLISQGTAAKTEDGHQVRVGIEWYTFDIVDDYEDLLFDSTTYIGLTYIPSNCEGDDVLGAKWCLVGCSAVPCNPICFGCCDCCTCIHSCLGLSDLDDLCCLGQC